MKREISPLILNLLLFIYTQTLTLFFKVRCRNIINLNIVVSGHLAKLSDTAVDLGHTI